MMVIIILKYLARRPARWHVMESQRRRVARGEPVAWRRTHETWRWVENLCAISQPAEQQSKRRHRASEPESGQQRPALRSDTRARSLARSLSFTARPSLFRV